MLLAWTVPPWVVIGVPLLVAYLWPWIRLLWMAFQLPRPPALPFIGHVLRLRSAKGVSRLAIDLLQHERPLVCIWVSLVPAVVLLSPEFVQTLMTDPSETDKSFMYSIMKPFFGEGLLTAAGDRWRRNRRVMNPAFHVNVLGRFVPVFAANSVKMAAKMESVAMSGEPFRVADYAFPCALDIVCETALGAKVGAQDGLCQEFNTALRQAVEILMMRAIQPWLLSEWLFNLTPEAKKLKRVREVLMDLSSKVVNERRAYRKQMSHCSVGNNDNVGNDEEDDGFKENKKCTLFLDLLLDMQENDGGLSEEDLFNEVNTLMVAGHETSALVFSFCLLMIALHEDVQDRVYDELQSIFAEKPLEKMNLADLREMKFLEHCILETLRLYPTGPAIARTLSKDLQLGPFTLPAGCQVVVPILLLHRDPKTYSDPHSFKPDRFALERHPFSFLPFSAGPRGCIGQRFAMMELKTMLSAVLWRYRVHPVTSLDGVKLRWKLTLNTEKPLLFRLEHRDKDLGNNNDQRERRPFLHSSDASV